VRLLPATHLLIGYVGTRAEAEAVKRRVTQFLHDHLKLELSETKTLVTHAATERAHFLGYEIGITRDDENRNSQGNRTRNGVPTFWMPDRVIRNKAKPYWNGTKPIHRKELMNDHDYGIVVHYQQVYRGVVNYYKMALNLRDLAQLRWIMGASLHKTLAAKHQISVLKTVRKYAAQYTAENGTTYKVDQVTVEREGKPSLVARFGGVSLERDMQARLPDDSALERHWNRRNELVGRLLADTCELCGSQQGIEIHHVRRLRDLNQPGRKEKPAWIRVMAARQRKTLALCHDCHRGPGGPHAAGTGGTVKRPRKRTSGEPGARKPARPVRRGVRGKGVEP
jgi:hypothetical protein